MRRPIDIAGQKFGMLTAIRYLGDKKWHFECECGNAHAANGSSVRLGYTISCGCRSHISGKANNLFKHGLRRIPEYYIWQSMKRRCDWPKNPCYKNYGGRGISVCERWRGDFLAFYSDMGPRPLGGMLDRVDTNGGYSPDNCRWATATEQARNKRNNRRITVGGTTATLAEWSELSGIGQSTLSRRISTGWLPAVAVSKPSQRMAH